MAIILLMSFFAIPSFAASVSYQDFDPQIVVDGDANLITIDIPVDYYKLGLRDGNLNTLGSWSGVDSFTYHITNGEQYSILFTIFQNGVPFSLTDIPNGTVFNVDFSVTTIASFFEEGVGFQTEYWWYDASGATVSWEYHNESPKGYNGLYSFSFPVSKRDGITSFSFGGTYYPAPCISPYDMRFSLDSVQMQFSISNFYLLQQSNQQTHALLDEVNRQLAEQGKTMQDILNQQTQTNDKLDSVLGNQQQTNDKLDKLPGQIGDEMQGVLDNEKQEAESSGNDFVDQILGALPDPSTDVLAAMKSLTDATAYTGTDAVLPIPAIVLPGIDGLFPRTEIWGGTDFDLGSYIGMLPPALLTLVQSLFTIAIVLYAVYELKGIISYCLTLRESKGG